MIASLHMIDICFGKVAAVSAAGWGIEALRQRLRLRRSPQLALGVIATRLAEINRMASAFEHDDLKRALGL
jgi:hypothetical protein